MGTFLWLMVTGRNNIAWREGAGFFAFVFLVVAAFLSQMVSLALAGFNSDKTATKPAVKLAWIAIAFLVVITAGVLLGIIR